MKRRTGTRAFVVMLCIALLFPHTAFAVTGAGNRLADGTTVTNEILPLDKTVDVFVYDKPEPVVVPEPAAIQQDETAAAVVYEEPEAVVDEKPEAVVDDVYHPEDDVGLKMEDEIDLRLMEAGLEDNPKPLTLADLIADFDIQPSLQTQDSLFQSSAPFLLQSRMLVNSVPAPTYPDTVVIGSDNENNAHTGIADGDVDAVLGGGKANYPIEISFTLNNLPAESAYIAIKALDVDEEAGEKDYVFINDAPAYQGIAGESISALSGNNNQWNTTVMQIPISKLHLGKNYVSITVSSGWYVTIDWIQVILDGGAEDTNITDFSIELNNSVQNGSNVEIESTIKILQTGSTEYYTEYMLNNAAGDNISSYFGTAAGVETARLSMPLNSPTGTYTVTGLIKDKVTETIKASDTITFDFVNGQVRVFGPKVSHSLSPATITNGSVTIQLSAENNDPGIITDVEIWYEGENIIGNTSGSITTAAQSVSQSGTYAFAIKYTRNGTTRTANYNVTVSNIDKAGPLITATNVSVIEETNDADVLTNIHNAITVTDNFPLPADPYTLSLNSGFAATTEAKTVTITARDTAGNESAKDITVTIIPKTVQITQHEVSVNDTALTASLSATLDFTGGLDITESGFVWGVSQNPTYEVCNGRVVVAGAVVKGGSISASAGNLTEGVNCYARAYIKAGGSYYYSDQKSFGIGAPQNGSFSVSTSAGYLPAAGGMAAFTISRPSDQTEGSQIVHYRTVNGTAVGNLHFQHQTGTLTFAEGEYSKTVEVPVYGVSVQYGSNTATAFQNNARSFYFEIYKVEGGATIGTNRAEKTISLDSSMQVSPNSYNQYNPVGIINLNQFFIVDEGYAGNAPAQDTVSFDSLDNTPAAYLDATADHYALRFDLAISEDDDGYQWIQVADNISEFYFVRFDHNISSWDPTRINYTFPMTTNAEAQAFYSSSRVAEYRGSLTDSNHAVNIGKNRTVYLNYDASGEGDDDWYKDDFRPSIRAIDTAEPQLLAVAPMAGSTYNYGDVVYISLIFNEIIGSVSGITINTNVSDTPFTYVGGVGTNVLVFKGIVDKEGQSFTSVELLDINGKDSIKDVANNAIQPVTATTGSTGIDANTFRPTVSFTGSSTGTLPRHSAVVAIGDAVSAKYAWSQSSAMPVSGWMSFTDATGDTLTETLAGGANGTAATWYLHVLAAHANGNTRWEYQEFIFQQPTLSVTVDNTNWAQSRSLALAVTNSSSAPVSISMTGEGTGTYTGSQAVNVTADGTYTFTLTDGYGSSIVKSVEVSRIDRTQPVITLHEYGNTNIKYTSLDFGASATEEEGGSGLAAMEYQWTDSQAVPASGWTVMAVTGGVIPTYSTVGTVYLHVKARDNAGNTAYACSEGYTVISNTPPAIEVTGGTLPVWQGGSVTLNYTVTKTGAAIVYINAANTVMQGTDLPNDSDYPYIGSISVSENGLYTFMVMDENGLSDTKTVVVNFIDNEAPVALFGYGSGSTPTSWAQSKTVTVSVNDNASPVVDSNGAITAYGGSGVTFVAWKKGAGGAYSMISNGGSFTADEDSIYYVRVTDAAGNSTEYSLPISGIDTAGPTIDVETPAAWQRTAYNAMVTYADAYSGISSAQYAIAGSKAVTPASLSSLPESGSSIMVSAQGSSYIYYEVTDNAGNTTYGWSDEINIDTAEPLIESVQYQIINSDGTIGEPADFNTGGTFFNKPIRITAKVSDIVSGPASVTYSIEGTINTVTVSESRTAAFDLAPDISGDLVIGAADIAGNATADEDKAVYAVNLENHPPVISFSGAAVTDTGSNTWLQGAKMVTVESNDSVNGEVSSSLDEMSITVKRRDGTAYDEIMTDLSQTFANISDTTGTVSKAHDVVFNAGGKYEITVTAVDRAGNSADLQKRYINVDTDSPADNPILTFDGAEVVNNAYYQGFNYIVVPVNETDSKQSPVKAQYMLNNSINTANNVNVWTEVSQNNVISVLEGPNTIQLRTIDAAGNISGGVTYTFNCDNTRPSVSGFTPANGATDQSITPLVSFTADKPLVKGDGYFTIYNKRTREKVMDVHSSNNRVKLSNEDKNVSIALPELLAKGIEYYAVIDEGFVTDRAGNEMAGFGGEGAWSFNTAANPVISDSEIVVLGYSVELISKADTNAEETSQNLTAVTDRQAVKQHNIIARAGYSENGIDYFMKLKITPIMSATPQLINVSTTEGTAVLSGDKKYIDVLIPRNASEAVVTISLGGAGDNQFTLIILNSSYTALVEISGGINASADETNLLNSVDLSEEVETAQQPGTTVDVTLKLVIEQKEKSEIPGAGEIQQAVPGAALRFLDITLEKVVTTTVAGGSPITDTEAVTATQQPVVIIIDLPEELRGRYIYQIIREHNGIIDVLPAEVIDNGTRLRFGTDRFSTYSIAYRHRPGSSEIISSITAETKQMAVDVTKLKINTGTAANVNTLLPYFTENGAEVIAGLSAVTNGQLKWIAQEGKTYWFKYNSGEFDDIQAHWGRDDILFVSARELFNGTAPGKFSPDMSMTRGMFVTVLGRLWRGSTSDLTDSSFKDSGFTDVAADAWYAPYVGWAAEAGIINGYGNGIFGPDDEITREQMALIIAKYAGYTGLELNKENEAVVFPDSSTISLWAKDAVEMVQEAGIIKGTPGNGFNPKGSATRAEVAAVLKGFIRNVVE